jgi:hypothetical protein
MEAFVLLYEFLNYKVRINIKWIYNLFYNLRLLNLTELKYFYFTV